MDFQEKLLEIVAPDTPVTFLAETSVQLWQRQTSMELIVYCCDPRLDSEDKAVPDLIPFQGQIEYTTGEALRGDAEGILKGRPDPLKDADFPSAGERDLQKLLATLEPARRDGEYVFVTVPAGDERYEKVERADLLMEFKELEGITFILNKQLCDKKYAGLFSYSPLGLLKP
eukprot:s7525_g2.t1